MQLSFSLLSSGYEHSSETTASVWRVDVLWFHLMLMPKHLLFLAQLLLMKRGGKLIYAGPLGNRSRQLIKYFEVRGINHFGYQPFSA